MLAPVYPERHLTWNLSPGLWQYSDLRTLLLVCVLHLFALVSHPSSFPNSGILTMLTTLTTHFYQSSSSLSSHELHFLTGCLTTALSSTSKRLLCSTSKSSPSCTFPLWNYIVQFMNVWVLHNAACTVGKQILTVYLNDNCARKDCQRCVCFGCVCTCADVTALFVCFIVCVNMWRKSGECFGRF